MSINNNVFNYPASEIVVVAYGIMSRIAQNAIEELRAKGMKIGMMRPKTLFPFPKKRLQELTKTAQGFFVAEMCAGQIIEDVKLAIEHKRPVGFYGCYGGSTPTVDDLKKAIELAYKKTVG